MNQKQSLSVIIKQSQIICAALIIGQLFFLGVAFFVTNQNGGGFGDQEALDKVLSFVVAALGSGSILGSYVVFNSKLTNIKTSADIEQKLTQYRAAQIVRWALLEGPSFFSIIAYIITGDILFVLVSIAIILLFIPTFPTMNRFEKDLELTWEEKNQLNE